jgi:repressor LexA
VYILSGAGGVPDADLKEEVMQKLPVLTKRQKSVLAFVTAFIEAEGYAPTLEEIRAHIGLAAVSTVHEHIERLIEKGYLTRGWNQSRSLALTPEVAAHHFRGIIPLMGTVAAGSPIEAVPNPEDISVPEELIGKGKTFALRAKGDSMVDEGILDGDTLIIERAEVAENGMLVIALVRETDAAVKRFYKRGGRVELVSANERHPPMVLNARDVRIQGVVVGLVRRYR